MFLVWGSVAQLVRNLVRNSSFWTEIGLNEPHIPHFNYYHPCRIYANAERKLNFKLSQTHLLKVSHMKRARAGSISGRLRSASDLEEKGLIDKSQKGVLKDLIISGDSELQAALDLYDKGDASQLEGE